MARAVRAQGSGGRVGRPGPSRQAGIRDEPSRPALRLLTALASDGAVACPDALREDRVVVRTQRAGISLGRGSHDRAALDDLAARGLVASDGSGERSRSAITEAGVAHLRRHKAGQDADAFGAQHREMTTVEFVDQAGRDRLAVNAQESPLAWLRRRHGQDGEPLIDAAAFEAGERLRRDLTFAGMLPSVTARWDGAVGGGGAGLRDPAGAADAVIAARQRVRGALDAVEGDFADLLVDLCGFLKGLETIERERRWPPRSGKVVVRLALRRLAAHYGLGAVASGFDAARGLRSWNAPPEPAG